MKAADIMTRQVVTLRVDDPVVEALRKLLDARISGAPVVDGSGALVGMLTEGDFMRRSETDTERRRSRWLGFVLGPGRVAADYVHAHGRRVDEVMTCEPVTIAEDTPLDAIVELMESRRIKRVPVLRDGAIVGVVSRADLVRAFVSAASEATDLDRSDAAIRRRIGAELAAQDWSPKGTIHITVHGGVVDLDGIVMDERLRAALKVLIENVAGVTRVRDHLTTIEPLTGSIVTSPENARHETAPD